MTYYLTVLTNDKARLIVSETRSSDRNIVDMVANYYKAFGYILVRRQEG